MRGETDACNSDLTPCIQKGLEQLHSLDLARNGIRTISPACLQPVANTLETLELSGNLMSGYALNAGLFWGLRSVKTLFLDGNRIESITVTAFHDLTNLQKLSLTSNPVSFIEDGAFAGMSKLKILTMANSRLTMLQVDIFKGTALERISLDGSRIAQVDEGVFPSTLQSVGMYGNPSVCTVGYHGFEGAAVVTDTSCVCAPGYHPSSGSKTGDSCHPNECWRTLLTGEPVLCPPDDPLQYQVGGAPCAAQCSFGGKATAAVTCGANFDWLSEEFDICGGSRAAVGTLDEPINVAVPQTTYAVFTGDQRANEVKVAQAQEVGAVTRTIVAKCWEVTIRPAESALVGGNGSNNGNSNGAADNQSVAVPMSQMTMAARRFTVTVSLSESTGVERRKFCSRLLAPRSALTIPLRTYYKGAGSDEAQVLHLSARIVSWRVNVMSIPLRTEPMYWTAGTIPFENASIVPQLQVNAELPTRITYEANGPPGLLLQVKISNYKAVLATASNELVPLISGIFPVSIVAYENGKDPRHLHPYQVGAFDLVVAPPLRFKPIVHYVDAGVRFEMDLSTVLGKQDELSSTTSSASRAALAYRTDGIMPFGLTLDASTGILSGARSVLGRTREIYVVAEDQNGASISLPPVLVEVLQPFTPLWDIAVVGTPAPIVESAVGEIEPTETIPLPMVTPTSSASLGPSLPQAVLHQYYAYTPHESSGHAVTYVVADGSKMPNGLKLNSATGEVYGIPLFAGVFTVTIVGRLEGPAVSGIGDVFKEGLVQSGIVNGEALTLRVEDCNAHTCGYDVGECVDTVPYDGSFSCNCNDGYVSIENKISRQHVSHGVVDLCFLQDAVNSGAGGDSSCDDEADVNSSAFSDPSFRRIIVGVILTLVGLFGITVFLWVGKSHFGLFRGAKASMEGYKDEELASTKRGRMRVLKQPRVINAKNIKVQELIGEGHYGVCHRAQLRTGSSGPGAKKSNRAVVCKIMHDDLSGEDVQTMDHEAMVMSQFDKNQYVLRLIGVVVNEDINKHGNYATLVTQYCVNGSLLDYLKMCMNSSVHQLTTANKFTLCVDVARGMKYLGSISIVHRDLAARNVLINEEHRGVVADFGMAFFLHRKGHSPGRLYVKHQDIPLRWSAPEVLAWREFSIASDVWAFGILICEVFNDGAKPYPEMSNDEVHEQVPKAYRMPCPDGCPQEAHESATALCWEKEPSDRLGFRELIERLERFAQRVSNAGGDEGSSWAKSEQTFEGSAGRISVGRTNLSAGVLPHDSHSHSHSHSDGSDPNVLLTRRSISDDNKGGPSGGGSDAGNTDSIARSSHSGGSSSNSAGSVPTPGVVTSYAGVAGGVAVHAYNEAAAGGGSAGPSPSSPALPRNAHHLQMGVVGIGGVNNGGGSLQPDASGYVRSLPPTPMSATRFGTAPWSSYGDAMVSTGIGRMRGQGELSGHYEAADTHRRMALEKQVASGGVFFRELAERRESITVAADDDLPSFPISKAQSAPVVSSLPFVVPERYVKIGGGGSSGSSSERSGASVGDGKEHAQLKILGRPRLPSLTIEDTNGNIEDVGVGAKDNLSVAIRGSMAASGLQQSPFADLLVPPSSQPRQEAPQACKSGFSTSSGSSTLSAAVMSALAEGMASPAAAKEAALHTVSGAEAAMFAVYLESDGVVDGVHAGGDGVGGTSRYTYQRQSNKGRDDGGGGGGGGGGAGDGDSVRVVYTDGGNLSKPKGNVIFESVV